MLVLSSVVAQAITLVATPILSRIYEPAAFGYLTLVVSVTGMIIPAVALRLESALMLPKDAREASALLFMGLTVAALISLLSAGVLELCFAAGLLRPMAALAGFSAWVGGITFFSGIFVLFGQFALRVRNYPAVAARNVTQAATTALAQVGAALIAPSAVGLVGGYGAGRLAGVVPLIGSVRGEIRRFQLRDVRRMAREYRAFPLLFAPAALMNASALALPVLFAGIWFSVADAGQWGMAERILAVPLVVIATAVSQVVEARLAFHARSDALGSASYYLKVSLLLLAVSALVGVAVLLLAPLVVPWLLGDGWEDAARIMQLLVPMLVTRLIASPLSKALVVAKWARVNLVLDASRLLLILVVLFLCTVWGSNIFELVLFTSLAFALIYAATWLTGLAAARHLDRGNEPRAVAEV
ncbi:MULTISPECIES: lipopolysaccharide biosynthesis protein [unclassified Microbacterium]|uniref:lipopolysaccharide biosynthesis protein n=1 Tax=unclassified Microbacterium TaxID=2609290 RepID=UPI0011C452F9|nr:MULTISPECIES: oligosaccharide flippase family protein [unclassified Microbacterium]MBT2485002.1 oligosaccharide flippase family protein [Microbacterium sp. ISL-108]